MRKRVLLSLLLIGLVALATAQWNITGYLTSEMEPVQIDSAMLSGVGNVWVPTPGWMVNPGETDSFNFPSYPSWPAAIKLAAFISGEELMIDIIRPEQDSWYEFQPPHEQIRVRFTGYVGMEEINGQNQVWTKLPTLLTNNIISRTGMLASGEIINASGQVVRSLPLTPGVYFYRPHNNLASGHRFTLIR